MPRASRLDTLRIDDVLSSFNQVAKWEGKDRHICTLASFCADVIENSKSRHNPEILKTLNKIIDYYDRKGKLPAPSPWSGLVAAQKWAKIMEDA